MPFDFTTAMLQATVAVAQSAGGPGVLRPASFSKPSGLNTYRAEGSTHTSPRRQPWVLSNFGQSPEPERSEDPSG